MADDILDRLTGGNPTVYAPQAQAQASSSDILGRLTGAETPSEYSEAAKRAGALIGRSTEEHKQILKEHGFSPEVVNKLGQEYDVARAKEAERQKGFGLAYDTSSGKWVGSDTPVGDWLGQTARTGLGFADIFDANRTGAYNDARKRLAAGQLKPGDAEEIARYEQLRQNEAQGTLFGSKDAGDVAKGILGIPKIAQETMVGSAALRGLGVLGQGARAPLLAAANPSVGASLLNHAAVTAALLPTAPSMWLEEAREKNVANDRGSLDIRGFGPALLHGYANLFVLGRLQSGIAGKALGKEEIEALTAKFGRELNLRELGDITATRGATLGTIGKKAGAFVAEQGIADSATNFADTMASQIDSDFAKQFKISSGYGTFENLLSGNAGEAMKQATSQILMGAAFAGFHRRGAADEVLNSAREDLDAARKKGVHPDVFGRMIVDQYQTLGNALDDNPNLTRGQAEQIMAKAGVQPGKFLVSVMHNLPRSQATAEFEGLKNEFMDADLAKARSQPAGPTLTSASSAEPVKPRVMSADWSRPELENLSIAEVRSMADEAGVKSAGDRGEVIDRLMASEAAKRPGVAPAATPPKLGETPAEGQNAAPGAPGGQESASPPVSPVHAAVRQSIDATPGLSEGQKAEFHAAADQVFGAMPQAGHAAVATNLKGVKFYATPQEVLKAHRGAQIAALKAEVERLKATNGAASEIEWRERKIKEGEAELADVKSDGIAGGFDGQTLHLDGASKGSLEGKYGVGEGNLTTNHIAAHELGHAIDGPDFRLSKTPEWFSAWYADIKGKKGKEAPLTGYGAKSRQEGFAEFTRILYGSDVPTAKIEADFPHASAYFKKLGLWPAERSGTETRLPELFDKRVATDPTRNPAAHVDVGKAPLPEKAKAAEPPKEKLPNRTEPAHEIVGDIYDRAATATPEEIVHAESLIRDMSKADLKKTAEAVGMVGKPTVEGIISRILDRHGATIRRRLVGRHAPPNRTEPAKAEQGAEPPLGEGPVPEKYQPIRLAETKDGKDVGMVSISGVGSAVESNAARTLFPGVVGEGETAARLHGIRTDKSERGTGLGRSLLLRGMAKSQANWLFNSQASPSLAKSLNKAATDGLIDLHWHKGEEGGSFVARLTEKGRAEAEKSTPKEATNEAERLPSNAGRAGLPLGEPAERAGPLPPAAEESPDSAIARAVAEGSPPGGLSERPPTAPAGAQAEEAQLREAGQAAADGLTPESQRIVMRDPFMRDLFQAAGVKLAEPRQRMGERKEPSAADDAATKMLMDKINENAANPPSNPSEVGVGAARKGFLPDIRDSEWFKGLQAAAKRFVERVQEITNRHSGASAPRTSRHSEEAGNDIAHLGSARQFANAAAPSFLERIMTDPDHNDAASRDIVGAVMVEDSLRYARQQHAAAGRDEKAANVGTVVGSGRTNGELAANPLKTEADYQRLRAEPWVQEAIKRYEQEYVPVKEKYYRESQGLEPEDPLGSETQIPGRPIYRHALAEGELRYNAGGEEGGPGAGQARGNMTGQRARKLGQAMEAKGTGHYEIDLGKILEADLRSLVPNADKAKLYRTLVAEGLGKWAKPGQGPDIYKRIPDVRPPRGTQEAQRGEIDLYVHPDVYDEVRQVLAVDEPAKAVPLAGALATATLASTVEATYHLRNLFSLLTRPGMNPLVFMKNVRRIVQGDAEVKQRIMELTEIGSMKEHGSESPNAIGTGFRGGYANPANYIGKNGYLSKMMTVADRAMRLTADHAFDNLAKAGKVENTEAARRDFINQLGNYNKLIQPKWVAWLRDTGWGPFATAGTNFYMQGLRSLTLSHGLKATSRSADMALRAEMLLRMAVLPAIAHAINMAIWGRPDGDDKTPLFGLKLGEKGGKTSYLDLGGLVPLSRGMRETGLMALAEGSREGARKAGTKAGDIIDKAASDVYHSLLHPAQGPLVASINTTMFGTNTLGTQVAPRANVRKGESQTEMNAYAALFQANPIVESWFRPLVSEQAGIKEKKHEPTAEERAFKMMGPFGVKTRSQAPGAPHRTMTIPLGTRGSAR